MFNNRTPFFSGIVFAACLILYTYSCKVEPLNNKVTPWLSNNFAGTFSGNDVCLILGTQQDSVIIAATGATQVSITNLYGSGKVFTGTVSNDSCTVPPQVYNNGSGNAVMQGNFILTGDTINLAIIVSTFGQEDKCNAILIKK